MSRAILTIPITFSKPRMKQPILEAPSNPVGQGSGGETVTGASVGSDVGDALGSRGSKEAGNGGHPQVVLNCSFDKNSSEQSSSVNTISGGPKTLSRSAGVLIAVCNNMQLKASVIAGLSSTLVRFCCWSAVSRSKTPCGRSMFPRDAVGFAATKSSHSGKLQPQILHGTL